MRIQEAETIPASEYPEDQCVVDETGRFHDSIADLIETCRIEKVPIQDRVWATYPEKFHLDINAALVHAFEEWAGDSEVYQLSDLVGVGELWKAAETFNDTQKMSIYFEGNKAIDLTGLKAEMAHDNN